jgi:hypothetical protein
MIERASGGRNLNDGHARRNLSVARDGDGMSGDSQSSRCLPGDRIWLRLLTAFLAAISTSSENGASACLGIGWRYEVFTGD